MKNILVSGLLIILFTDHGQTQNFYLSAAGTYQFKLGGFPFSETTSNNGTSTNVSRLFNIASGPGAGIIFGYNLKTNLALEGRFIYQSGNQIFEDYYSSFGYVSTYKTTFTGKFLRFEPLLRINFGEKKLNYYISAGPCINLFSVMTEENFNTNPSEIEEENFEYKGNIAYGGSGLIGIKYSLNENFSVFAEGNITAQSWAPKGYSKTKHLINGTDRLPYESVYDKETEFVEEYTYSGSPDTSKPDKQTKLYFPLSTWGFFAGIKFTF